MQCSIYMPLDGREEERTNSYTQRKQKTKPKTPPFSYTWRSSGLWIEGKPKHLRIEKHLTFKDVQRCQFYDFPLMIFGKPVKNVYQDNTIYSQDELKILRQIHKFRKN